MGRRNEREDMVIDILAGAGWSRDARAVPGACRAYNQTYSLGLVAAGESGKPGRSTTGIDAFRATPSGGLLRVDMLSVKGSALEGGSMPRQAYLMTGCRSTLAGVIAAARRGAAFPVFHYASGPDTIGEGYYLAYDAAALIRAVGSSLDTRPPPPGHRWPRGGMPPVSVGMTPGIKSGGKYTRHVPGEWTDEWTYSVTEDSVAYPRLEVGYHNAGLSGRWQPCKLADVPAIIDRAFDWTPEGCSVLT